jgi:hypothetical protein
MKPIILVALAALCLGGCAYCGKGWDVYEACDLIEGRSERECGACQPVCGFRQEPLCGIRHSHCFCCPVVPVGDPCAPVIIIEEGAQPPVEVIEEAPAPPAEEPR